MADQPQNPRTPAESAAPASGGPQSGLDALLATAGGASNPNVAATAEAGAEALLNADDVNALLEGRPMPDRASKSTDLRETHVPDVSGTEASPTAPATAIPVTAAHLPEFQTAPRTSRDFGGLDMLMDVNLRVKIELGRTRMLVEDVLRLGEGSVVELDKLAGDPVDIYVSDRLIAHGEILVLNDSFCVRVSEIVTLDPHRIGAA